jgi:hypothetical protein
MKFPFTIFLFLLVMLLSLGCGMKKASSTLTSAQSALIAKNGVTLASGQSDYVGTWTGYLASDYTTIIIKTDGSVAIPSNAQSIREKLVRNSQNQFFITDSKDAQLLSLDLFGGNLTLFDADNSSYSFSKN